MAGIVNYIKESFRELKNNVTWTPWSEVQSLTILVAVFSVPYSVNVEFLASYLLVFDCRTLL